MEHGLPPSPWPGALFQLPGDLQHDSGFSEVLGEREKTGTIKEVSVDALPRMQPQSDAMASGLPISGTFPAPATARGKVVCGGGGMDLGQDGCSSHSPVYPAALSGSGLVSMRAVNRLLGLPWPGKIKLWQD